MNFNLALLPSEEMAKINVDLMASGVAFKERYNMPVIPEIVEREQPAHLQEYFRQQLAYYRVAAKQLSRLPYEPKIK